MNPLFTKNPVATALGLALLAAGATSMAQTLPDAGRLLQEQQRGQPAAPAGSQAPRPAAPAPAALTALPAGASVLVSAFEVSGVTLLPMTAVDAVLAPFKGKSLDFKQLSEAAEAVSRLYRSKGYLVARTYIPAQDIRPGTPVKLIVLEGKLAKTTVRPAAGTRMQAPKAQAIFDNAMPTGQAITVERLERGLSLLSDWPGVEVSSVLSPGAQVGESDLTIDAKQGKLFSGAADVEPTGSPASGKLRLGVSGFWSDPTGAGDQVSLRGSTTGYTHFVQAGYGTWLGNSGLRGQANLGLMKYTLCCEFSTADQRGNAQSLGLSLSYPLIRLRERNVFTTAQLDIRQLANDNITGAVNRRKANVLSLGTAADWSGNGWGASAGATLAIGNIDLSGLAADQIADAATANTQGGFRKISLNAAYSRAVNTQLSWTASARGQLASKNLDSSETFGLGGTGGIKGYAGGEGVGDQGFLAMLEARYVAMPNVVLTGSVECGQITLHKNTWAGWNASSPTLPNSYSLCGLGSTVDWTFAKDSNVKLTIGRRLTEGKLRQATGLDADGKAKDWHFGIMAMTRF